MSPRTLVLHNVTAIDLAYINAEGDLRGYSASPWITVTGEIEVGEQVVADFSNIKRRLKAAIDDREHGYDHKLVTDRYNIVMPSRSPIVVEDSECTVVSAPGVSMSAPANAIRVLDKGLICQQGIAAALETDLANYLNCHPDFPGLRFAVGLRSDFNTWAEGTYLPDYGYACAPAQFSYCHGLPHSSSWGCNNIAHGHLSFLQVFLRDPQPYPIAAFAAITQLRTEIHNAYFTNHKHLVTARSLRYTCSRGDFDLVFRTAQPQIVLDTDTTIENICATLVDRHHKLLADAGVRALMVSEGLEKGSICLL